MHVDRSSGWRSRPAQSFRHAVVALGTAPLLLIGALLGLAALRSAVLGGGWVLDLDRQVLTFTSQHPLRGGGHLILQVLAELGQRGVTLILLAALLVRQWSRNHTARPTAIVGSALAMLALLGEGLKLEVGRLAPRASALGVHAGGVSWPSGHAANTMVCGGLIVSWLPGLLRTPTSRTDKAKIFAVYGLVLLVGGGALVLLRYHWVSDVLGGWLLGGVVLGLVACGVRFFDALRQRADDTMS